MAQIRPAPGDTGQRRPGPFLAVGAMVTLGILILGGCASGGAYVGTGAPSGATSPPRVISTLPPSVANGPCLSSTDPTQLCGGGPGVSLPPGGPTVSVAPLASNAAGLVVTMADDGTTLLLAVGQRFTLDLGEGVVWTVKVADGQVIEQVPGAAVPAGAQGVYEARARGQTVLTAAGMPRCTSGPCALFRLGFSVTITVG